MGVPEPKCEAVIGPDEMCGETASWRLADGTLFCQGHNTYDLEQGGTMERAGVWEDLPGAIERQVERIPAPPVPQIDLSIADLQSAILQKVAVTGMPEGLLVKISFIGLVRYLEAHDRWERLEHDGHQKRAPLWLDQQDAKKLVAMLGGQRGADARLLRQEIERLFEEAP